jgi:hypothetical protein
MLRTFETYNWVTRLATRDFLLVFLYPPTPHPPHYHCRRPDTAQPMLAPSQKPHVLYKRSFIRETRISRGERRYSAEETQTCTVDGQFPSQQVTGHQMTEARTTHKLSWAQKWHWEGRYTHTHTDTSITFPNFILFYPELATLSVHRRLRIYVTEHKCSVVIFLWSREIILIEK